MSKYTHLISDDIRENIEEYMYKHDLKPGDALPPERRLCEILGCNRVALRKAIAQMVGENLLFSVHGTGTFLAPAKFTEDASRFISFSSSWQSEGHRVTSKLIKFNKTNANLKTAQVFDIPLGAKVYELKRLRLIDDIPLTIETSYIEESHCPGLLSYNFDGAISLYCILREEYGINITRQQQNIRTSKIRADEARLLCVKEGVAAFYVTATGLTTDGTVIERSISIARADRFAISYQARACTGSEKRFAYGC